MRERVLMPNGMSIICNYTDFGLLDEELKTKSSKNWHDKFVDKLVTENNVICEVLRTFDVRIDEEVDEARELFKKYKTIQTILSKYSDLQYDSVTYRVGRVCHKMKRERIMALISTKCEICGYPINPKDQKFIHHTLPTYKGGSDNYTNLSILCPKCHTHLHDIFRYPLEADTIKKKFAINNNLYVKFLTYLQKIDQTKLSENENKLVKMIEIRSDKGESLRNSSITS